MPKMENKKVQAAAKKTAGQAAVELAVFGAILIFLLGTIIRSAYSNSYAQNQNFKAMRIAMLSSWRGAQAGNIARNSASVLFVEDRLSPDSSKYGDLDRIPFIAQGSGTFSYYTLYPLDPDEVSSNLPIMDVYINGQHFPFSNASYSLNQRLIYPTCSGQIQSTVAAQAQCQSDPTKTPQQCQAAAQQQCLTNQCFRNQREWVQQSGQSVRESQFEGIVPVSQTGSSADISQAEANNASAIFNALESTGVIDPSTVTGSELQVGTTLTQGTKLTGGYSGDLASPVSPTSLSNFTAWFNATYPNGDLNQVQAILSGDKRQYKIFYTMVPNGISQFVTTPPASCSGTNNALCATVAVPFVTCPAANLSVDGQSCINTNGDMQFDLYRTGDYVTVHNAFPEVSSCPSTLSMRCNIAWEWAATEGTDSTSIGLDPGNNQYPNYDINGSLKEVTIYGIDTNQDGTFVSYEDPTGGDIDLSWDANSCTPKPGLQTNAQIYTFTSTCLSNGSPCPTSGICSDGTACSPTYLNIKEGKLYNPETAQFVRSANKRDSIDLVQRQVQLSNNTYRFCSQYDNSIMPSVGATCSSGGQTATCSNGTFCTPPTCPALTTLAGKACVPGDICPGTCITTKNGGNGNGGNNGGNGGNGWNGWTTICNPDMPCLNPCTDGSICTPQTSNCPMTNSSGVSNMVPNADNAPNPVEVCVGGSNTTCAVSGSCPVNGAGSTCFTGDNMKKTCLDTSSSSPMLFVRSRLEDRRGRFWMTDTSGQLKVQ